MRILLAIGLIAGSVLAQAGSASMADPAPIIIQGFRTPESVLYDPRTDVYVVSNINGN